MYDSELNIIKRVRNGDFNAFEEIVQKYKDRAMTLTFRILKNRQDAEDSLQEAFIKTFKAVADKRFEERSKFSTYFYRIVYNTAVDHYKKLKSKNFNVFSTDESFNQGADEGSFSDFETKIDYDKFDSALIHRTESDVLDGEIQNLVSTYLDQLPEKYSVILTMFYINDLSHEEISQSLGLPMGTVKNRIFRAKDKLKEIILDKYSLENIQELYS
jgi:RNA polymerase sigma-70 factor (ECF subfamily)